MVPTFGETKDSVELVHEFFAKRVEQKYKVVRAVTTALLGHFTGSATILWRRYKELVKDKSRPSVKIVNLLGDDPKLYTEAARIKVEHGRFQDEITRLTEENGSCHGRKRARQG